MSSDLQRMNELAIYHNVSLEFCNVFRDKKVWKNRLELVSNRSPFLLISLDVDVKAMAQPDSYSRSAHTP